MPFNGSGVFERLYSWVTDRDNGVKVNAPRMDAETDGIIAGLNSVVNGTQPFIGPVKAPSGTASLPGFAFSGDANTGAYNPAADQWAVALGGVQALLLNGTAMTTTQLVRGPLGSAAAPALSNASDTGTGFYYPDSGANVAVARSGVQVAKWSDTSFESGVPVVGEAAKHLSVFVQSVTGTANSIVLGMPINGSRLTGMEFRFIPTAANTGSVTINIGWTGTVSCRTPSGAFLPENYLQPGIPSRVYFNGIQFIVDRDPEIITSLMNGSAIRYADGTQVCELQYDAVSDNWTTASGSFFTTSAAETWTFPSAFSSAPTISATALRANPNPVGAWVTSTSASEADWRPWATTSLASTTPKSVHLIARGRWY